MSKISKKPTTKFHLDFLSTAQKVAWTAFQQHDVLFLTGAAGSGKTHLAMAFAINEVLQCNKSKIILTRPIVEAAGEDIGYLPGTFHEKIHPYLIPMYEIMDRLLGKDSPQRELVNKAIDICPIGFMRGRTFVDAVCIFDEAQNGTKSQLKLFLSRFDKTSKIIVTGDPLQSDLKAGQCDLVDVMRRLETLPGVGIVNFSKESIVRHPMVGAILERLEE